MGRDSEGYTLNAWAAYDVFLIAFLAAVLGGERPGLLLLLLLLSFFFFFFFVRADGSITLHHQGSPKRSESSTVVSDYIDGANFYKPFLDAGPYKPLWGDCAIYSPSAVVSSSPCAHS